jgi:hypothetical protein
MNGIAVSSGERFAFQMAFSLARFLKFLNTRQLKQTAKNNALLIIRAIFFAVRL